MSERTAITGATQGPTMNGVPHRSAAQTAAQDTVVEQERVVERTAAGDERREDGVPAKASGRGTGVRRAVRNPRRARLNLVRIDPWSVMKTAFLLSVAFGIVTIVAVLMVWSVLSAVGVWDSINATVASVLESNSTQSAFDVTNYIGLSRILGFTLLVSVIDIVLITAIATLAAFLYNMSAALLGGIEVTLAEDER